MNKEEIRDKVINLLSDFFSITRVSIEDDGHIVNDLGGDSLDLVELIMVLEEEFDIEIYDNEAEGVLTVRDIVVLVSKKLSIKNSY